LVIQSGQPVWKTKKIITIYNSKQIKEYETLTQKKRTGAHLSFVKHLLLVEGSKNTHM